MILSPQSLDTELEKLLNEVNDGKMQLPEFQRDWTWDDNRIRGIIASLSQGYPMGAIMRLQYGNENIRFKYRTIEGVDKSINTVPEFLVLDGQQRLTSIYKSIFSKNAVLTQTEKKKQIKRFYYIDINKCFQEDEDRLDAIISMPEDKKIKANFDRDVLLDLSKREYEYKNNMFPVNIIFDNNNREDWLIGYMNYAEGNVQKYMQFRAEIIDTIKGYKLPVITLDKKTPRDAVCKVFENVNTGGVALTVFELVTATFATQEFDLRKDWQEASKIINGSNEEFATDLLNSVDETAFLTTITLFSSYKDHIENFSAISCKKKDVLDLKYESYVANKNAVLDGYKMARNFLLEQYIFRKRDLPYSTQIIPLASICAYIGKSKFSQSRTKTILSKWYWSGILGEMYGGANETRYANDIEDVVNEIEGKPSQNRTISSASFSATRLLTLQTRLSAAYKGIMALIYKNSCLDFATGVPMDIIKSYEASPDIHHIFPEDYCKILQYPETKWNSIVNKTPLFSATNRAIGGFAPNVYLQKILNSNSSITENDLQKRITSHLINYHYLSTNDFEAYLIDRAKKLLNLVEQAMGKMVSDKGAEETIEKFGVSLV